jgi:hypothetical protein
MKKMKRMKEIMKTEYKNDETFILSQWAFTHV